MSAPSARFRFRRSSIAGGPPHRQAEIRSRVRVRMDASSRIQPGDGLLSQAVIRVAQMAQCRKLSGYASPAETVDLRRMWQILCRRKWKPWPGSPRLKPGGNPVMNSPRGAERGCTFGASARGDCGRRGGVPRVERSQAAGASGPKPDGSVADRSFPTDARSLHLRP